MSGQGDSRRPDLQADALYDAAGYAMSTCALLHREGRVLLALDADDRQWRLPGGNVRRRETPTESLQRAMAGKLGIDVDVTSFLGVSHCPTECSLEFVFEVRTVGAARVDPDGNRVLHAMWFFGHALPENVTEPTRSVIDACSGLKPVPFLVTHHSDHLSVWQP